MARRLPALLALAAALVAIAPAHAGKPLPAFSGCAAKPLKMRPASIVVACGDGNFFITGLRWSVWNAQNAHAKGIAHTNDCTPNCAAGHFHTFPVAVRLFKPARCHAGQRRRFTRLFYRFVKTKPAHTPRSGTEPYPCV